MCAIFGATLHTLVHPQAIDAANRIMNHICRASIERGRDGFGYRTWEQDSTYSERRIDKISQGQYADRSFFWGGDTPTMIGNIRAEPTTEFVLSKNREDQQPYVCGNWSIVHNGTIANDHELRSHKLATNIDSAAIAEILEGGRGAFHFQDHVKQLKGSYAILAVDELDDAKGIHFACNYRPIWYIQTPYGVFFASSRSYFPDEFVPQMIEPYTVGKFTAAGGLVTGEQVTLRPAGATNKALVVCSGGLDSVVAASYTQSRLGMDVTLIHFLYGSRAQGPEVESVKKVAEYLGVPIVLFPLNVYSKTDSPLLDPDSKVAGGEAGAEFAHEWVPARNLLLLSVATAYAEANGFDHIVLGNNLEEAGAYPDNEPEFINRFNDMLPFAVGDGTQMKVIMPVGNLMKHEIVKLGLELKAPMHLTWSCYRAGEKHCGTCGPCYMRRKAFEINQAEEVIEYANS